VQEIPSLLYGIYKLEVERRGFNFRPTEETINNIKLASNWLTNRKSRSCLALMGNVGNGKSTLMHAIKRLIWTLSQEEREGYKHNLEEIRADDLTEIAKNGLEFNKWKRVELLAIDDAGLEPSVIKVWGNEKNPFVDLIYSRYDNQLFTIITTNLNESEFLDKYGIRISDRFAEMFDQIAFNNKSFRQPKTK